MTISTPMIGSTSPDVRTRRRATALWIRRRLLETALAASVLAVTLAMVTWPYATVLTRGLPESVDPMFSIWRLSWFAHAVRAHISIADANIFYPETGTFAFSDMMPLLGGVAAPLLWAGFDKVAVYNVLLAGGFVSSGLALFMAARTLQVPSQAAIVGAAIFTLAPYRIEHIMHLELQWLVGAVAAIASTVLLAVRPSPHSAFALAGSLVLQFLTSIYYAVFILPLLGAIWLACIPVMPNWRRTLRLTLAGGVLAGVLISPVALLHLRQGAQLGDRQISEVRLFSATAADYLSTPDENRLYGRQTDDIAETERRLFPGTLAIALAVAGLFSRRRRLVLVAIVFTALAFELSLGVNGTLYPYLYRWFQPWRGLRAPARYGAYVLLGISALATLGWERLLSARPVTADSAAAWRLSRTAREHLLTILLIAALSVEYRSPQRLRYVGATPAIYTVINMWPPGIVFEYPTPSKDFVPWLDADYAFWSTTHWRPLINGYSGYYPASYLERAARLERFPSDDTLAELRALGVRYVIIHSWAIDQPRRAQVLQTLGLRSYVKHIGSFSDWQASAELFELSP